MMEKQKMSKAQEFLESKTLTLNKDVFSGYKITYAYLCTLLEEYYSQSNSSKSEIEINNWNKLSEKVPEICSENYLVYKDGEIKISLFRGDWNMFHCDINRNLNEPFVTHWMNLPKPPLV